MAPPIPHVVTQALSEYRTALERAYGGRLQRVVLFGSTARGEATEDSDVDVLVVLDRITFAERGHAIDLATDIGLDHRLVMAPLVLSEAEWNDLVTHERRLPREIEGDGVLV